MPSTAYNKKALERSELLLQVGRSVLPKTDSNREARLNDFARWLADATHFKLEDLLAENGVDAETTDRLLVDFGQHLFEVDDRTVIFPS